MKEKLQEYALIAEIISAIAIVLSLIFVGLQVRQGSEATDANTRGRPQPGAGIHAQCRFKYSFQDYGLSVPG